jgi:hypothetical protein
MTLKKLPVGVDDFAKFIKNDFYYIDKTMFIAALLNNWGEVNLFTRPRRFGKSLNMSMLKAFLEIDCDKSLFDGLKISSEKELCDEYMGKFPVISISLKNVSAMTYREAVSALSTVIGREALRFRFLEQSALLSPEEKAMYLQLIKIGDSGNSVFEIPDAILISSLQILSALLAKHYNHKTIILIDEYDIPLDKAFQNGYYNEMISLIRNLFGNALKGNNSLYFAVLTGCLRISKESIFTGLNNLKTHGITDTRYEEYFGFTNQDINELLTYYGLNNQAQIIKDWYNGYQFGNISVYCPWDVSNYCDVLLTNPDASPENYWANTSGNEMVKRFIYLADWQTRDEIEQLIAGDSIIKEINQELTYNDLDSSIDNLWSVLFTTGYLTSKEKLSARKFRLVIPNMEIRDLFVSQVKEWFKEKATTDPQKLNALGDAFFSGDTEVIQKYLTDYLRQTISIRDTNVPKAHKENFYHGILLGLLSYPKRWSVKSNKESGDGYSDILVRNYETNTGLVIEIKYAEKGAFDSACERALTQIEGKKYSEVLLDNGMEKILKYGISFYKKQCRVVLGQ